MSTEKLALLNIDYSFLERKLELPPEAKIQYIWSDPAQAGRLFIRLSGVGRRYNEGDMLYVSRGVETWTGRDTSTLEWDFA